MFFPAGFDVDGKLQTQVQFTKCDENSSSKASYAFDVKRGGNDPMVVMTVTQDRSQWGGNFEVFEVTLTDKKSIETGGW